MKKIPQWLMIAGIALLVVSLVWWQQTFGFNSDFIKCLAVSDGICRVSSLSKMFGGSGYNPIVFWAGAICLVVGYLLKRLKIL